VWLQAEKARQQAELARWAEQVRRQAEENERAEQPKRVEIARENAKRAANNQAVAEKAFSENMLSLAEEYYRAAARCWHFAYRYDLEEECLVKANQIEGMFE
jgi:hypothetical protein